MGRKHLKNIKTKKKLKKNKKCFLKEIEDITLIFFFLAFPRNGSKVIEKLFKLKHIPDMK